MKRLGLRRKALATTVGLCLLYPCLSLGHVEDSKAEDGAYPRKPAAEFGLGAVVPTGQNLGTGFSYGLSVSKQFSKTLGLEIVLERNSLSIEQNFAGLDAGNLGLTSLLFNGYLFFPVSGRLRPYALFGVGFYFYNYVPNEQPPVPEKKVVDRFALNIGAGLDYMISDRVALTAKVRYNLVKTWVEDLPLTVPINEVNPDERDIIHFYVLVLSAGLKYYF